MEQHLNTEVLFSYINTSGGTISTHRSITLSDRKKEEYMSGIFTRPALDKIMNNADLTPEQRTEQVFALYGRALDEGYVSRSAAEEAKNAAVEAAKAGIQIPEPVDPKTTPEYMEVVKERDMLRAIGGEDFTIVKPKFREQIYGMMDHGTEAKPAAEQLILAVVIVPALPGAAHHDLGELHAHLLHPL